LRKFAIRASSNNLTPAEKNQGTVNGDGFGTKVVRICIVKTAFHEERIPAYGIVIADERQFVDL
jgi:hypothetical protein